MAGSQALPQLWRVKRQTGKHSRLGHWSGAWQGDGAERLEGASEPGRTKASQ